MMRCDDNHFHDEDECDKGDDHDDHDHYDHHDDLKVETICCDPL